MRQREASTRARVVQELLDTPAVQELVRARIQAEPDRMGALEAAVRRDPELAMGIAVAAVDWINDAARTARALTGLLADMPAPLVREVIRGSWERLDGDVFRDVWSSIRDLVSAELRSDPQWLKRTVDRALDGVDRDVIERTVDSTLDQVADVLAARPYLLRSIGRFALRVASGSVRAQLRR